MIRGFMVWMCSVSMLSVLNFSLVNSPPNGNVILLLGYVPVFLVQDLHSSLFILENQGLVVQWLVSPITGAIFKVSWIGFPSVGAVHYQQLHFVMMVDA